MKMIKLLMFIGLVVVGVYVGGMLLTLLLPLIKFLLLLLIFLIVISTLYTFLPKDSRW